MHERQLMIELNSLKTSLREPSHQRQRLPLFQLRLESAQILGPGIFNLGPALANPGQQPPNTGVRDLALTWCPPHLIR